MKPSYIRSYVRRQGRITHRQKQALLAYWKKYGIELQTRLNFKEIFSNQAPRLLEIGFGMGEVLAQLAEKHVDWNFIGVDVHRPGIGALLATAHEKKFNNLRIIEHDAVELFERLIPTCSIDIIQILYPDPWPKKRHHKRRLIQTSFLDLILPALKMNGFLLIATDWQDYARHIQTVLNSFTALQPINLKTLEHPLFMTRSKTKFEKRALKKKHSIFEYCVQKKN